MKLIVTEDQKTVLEFDVVCKGTRLPDRNRPDVPAQLALYGGAKRNVMVIVEGTTREIRSIGRFIGEGLRRERNR